MRTCFWLCCVLSWFDPTGVSHCRSGTRKVTYWACLMWCRPSLANAFCVAILVHSSKWSHQAHHGSWHSVFGVGNHGHQRQHNIHPMSCRSQEDSWHQASFPCDDYQECKCSFSVVVVLHHWLVSSLLCIVAKILYLRGNGARRQECAQTIPRVELSVNDAGQAIHLYNADASRRGMESNSVQLVWFHSSRIRNQLHRNSAGADSCELPHPPHLLLRPPLLGGRVAAGVQAVLAHRSTAAKRCWWSRPCDGYVRRSCVRFEAHSRCPGVPERPWVLGDAGYVNDVRHHPTPRCLRHVIGIEGFASEVACLFLSCIHSQYLSSIKYHITKIISSKAFLFVVDTRFTFLEIVTDPTAYGISGNLGELMTLSQMLCYPYCQVFQAMWTWNIENRKNHEAHNLQNHPMVLKFSF